jgi:hypothetical protein
MALFRPGEVCSGLGLVNPAQAAACLLFKYTYTYNSTYILYISHNKGVLWYTWGYIPDKKFNCGYTNGGSWSMIV